MRLKLVFVSSLIFFTAWASVDCSTKSTNYSQEASMPNVTQDSLDLLIGPQKIKDKIAIVARQIEKDYQGRPLVVVMVMKGAVCVTSDLIRELKMPVMLEYIQASSYGNRGTARGALHLLGLDRLSLEGKDVLVVDDIFDSGTTLTSVVEALKKLNPQTIRSLVLLHKKVSRETSYFPDYVLFDIEDRFVVGYGLDYKELYRGLPGIYQLVNLGSCPN